MTSIYSYIARERTLGLKFVKGLKDFRWVRKLYGAILLWGCWIDWRTGSPLLSSLEAYLFQTHCRLSLSTLEKMPTAQATIFSRADLWVLRGTYPFFCEILYYFLKVLYKICSIYIAGPCCSNIQRINHYLADKYQGDLSSAYSVLLNNWGLCIMIANAGIIKSNMMKMKFLPKINVLFLVSLRL